MTATDFPRCATCQYWEPSPEVKGPPLSEGFGKCLSLSGSEKVGVVAVSGFDGGHLDFIETQPDFGCINHSEITGESCTRDGDIVTVSGTINIVPTTDK